MRPKFELDMTMMFAMHGALRRELGRIAQAARRGGDRLRAAPGWTIFATALRCHHETEDETLWPMLREALAGDVRALALMDAMEAEHTALDPLLEAIEAGADRPSDLVGQLAQGLEAHLDHEENELLPLIDATLSAEQWRRFGEAHGAKVAPHASRIIPWVLEGRSTEDVQAILARLPAPARERCEQEWVPAYRTLELWP